jgi:response regulator RpfG family c-di-GMP phosphodiesterase
MIDPVTWAILIGAIVATVWLVYYVHYYLPGKMEERFLESMKAFSTAIELRFPIHEGCTDAVVELSGVISDRLGLSGMAKRDLLMAARLRDIGLCAIPYSLVNGRAEAEWTLAEQSTYDRHPEVSGAMLELVPSLRHLAEVVRAHHTNFDGSSRDGVAGGQALPIQARILKVTTEYVWMRRNHGESYAQARIFEQREIAYCPEVVDAFAAVLTSSRVESPQPSLA